MDSQNEKKLGDSYNPLQQTQLPAPLPITSDSSIPGTMLPPVPIITPRFRVLQDDSQPGQQAQVYPLQKEADKL